MIPDDDHLGRLLLERGLLSPEEYDEAFRLKKDSGKPLSEILIERPFLSRSQLDDVLASCDGKARFCDRCNLPVYVPRNSQDGAQCPRCLGPIGWRDEEVVEQVENLETLVRITQDELPEAVRAAKADLANLFGKYVLLDEIGRGGYGVVQKAWDTLLGEYVAIKFLREPELTPLSGLAAAQEDRDRVRMFLKEARAALRLRHPHIVPMHDVGKVGVQYYISMEYVEGETLADRISGVGETNHPSLLAEAPEYWLGVLRDIAQAAHYAHTFREGIVHCDLKPANILLDREGVAFIMDFGLAQALGSHKSSLGIPRGTPGFMAPEQALGRPERIGPCTDIYAIGAILFALMTGQAPFAGEPREVLTQTAYTPPRRPTDLLGEGGGTRLPRTMKLQSLFQALEALCLRCLAKESTARPRTALDLAEDFEKLRHGLGISPEPETHTGRDGIADAGSDSTPTRVVENRDPAGTPERRVTKGKGKHYRFGSPWVGASQEETDLLCQFRVSLLARLDRERPKLDHFMMEVGPLSDVELMKATETAVFLLSAGKGIEAAWSHITPETIGSLAERVGMVGQRDADTLAIIFRNAEMDADVSSSVTSLPAGTLIGEGDKAPPAK